MTTLPRLAPIPSTKPSGSPTPWRRELRVAVRDGLACRVCALPLAADDERVIVRVDPAAGDDLENLALVCSRCAEAHRVHPQPIPAVGERLEPLL